VRIAVDSSVLIAAHITRAGVCAEMMADLLMHHQLVTSDFIRAELHRKLVEKFDFFGREAAQVVAMLRRAGMVVAPADLASDACRDPTDIPDLGTAVAGECALLISVDRDLLDLHQFNEFPIIRPGEYWRLTSEPG
jgi:putative PIN family toxin of toxin-antitoxin system